MKQSKLILPIIVISQFFCTSLWFAGNSVITNLIKDFNLNDNALGDLTSSVQFGFIIGTLIFAIMAIADRFSPSKVFLISAILGTFFNLIIINEANNFTSLIVCRFLTGFFLAGIYPVGMKIAADYFNKGLGKSLGFLVGALVLGTALPHLLKDLTQTYSWKSVIIATSSLSTFGGLLMFVLVPDGPYRKPNNNLNLLSCFSVFKNRNFRSIALVYFGHMWELYAFWTFVPLMLTKYSINFTQTNFNIPLLSFVIIGIGGVACVIGAYIAEFLGTKKTAAIALLLSCCCCILSPFVFSIENKILFIGFLVFWGMVVIADSPLLSTLIAQNVKGEIKATALTIVNSIGYLVTIISIQFVSKFIEITDSNYIFFILAIGPILGLASLKMNKSKKV
ncbi:MFS transporter [Lacinutrix venerupis]|uniref:MFS transporter n=1 Tax=Lacinutrix venerupis TaxID=1486034 RepID=A0AAC9PX33_9FLAO|nr:MFS transporter [Lacinutrix venerupis]APY00701.1 MFS transporter [Lacinutrix venerupis]